MRRVPNVRFASSEKLLDAFISLRPVLLKMLKTPMFTSIYVARNQEGRQQRQVQFVDPIMDDVLVSSVLQLHKIFPACRTYLRVFDAEAAWCSEVFEASRILEETIETLLPGASLE